MKIRAILLCLLSPFLLQPSAFSQGPLTPPTAPTPSMKALDEIEPRINIQRTINPLSGDANYKYIINTPGSYYLTGNLAIAQSTPNGIHVIVGGVTIDLNGFRISRSSGSTGDAITIDPTAHQCVVKNGSIKGFSYGVHANFGAKAGLFEHLTVSECGTVGLAAGEGWQITSCTVHDNPGVGIASLAGGNTYNNCVAYKNVGVGINASGHTAVINCTASNNSVGIDAVDGSSIIHCTAAHNVTDGIQVHGNCLALNNECHSNGEGGIGAGILIDGGAGNRVESNNLSGNDYGIKADSAGNLIIKNSTRGNSTSFSLVAGNSVGEQINVWNNGAGATITSSNSWANLLY